MNGSAAILLNQGEGESYWVLGDLYTFLATGNTTNGAYTLIDQIVQPQNGPPPHIHHQEDEAFYVLEGRFSFLNGDKESLLEAGAFLNIPKGTLHAFRNIGEQPGRLLVLITPAGFENFFYAIGTPAAGLPTPPAFDPAIIDKISKLAGTYHMELLLPDR